MNNYFRIVFSAPHDVLRDARGTKLFFLLRRAVNRYAVKSQHDDDHFGPQKHLPTSLSSRQLRFTGLSLSSPKSMER
ncbi:hypothetical protein PsorP6_014641 [Peronosclerospora sorghi]|uniref:Uncharacterized protein n=1 Tax=Peronosclerospora sorghi TaxID=230839 RepID=A0ACC0VW52_9STRA|nr:hypothetical protein PsorP6_014641 [Peronosclerospora sorghi]